LDCDFNLRGRANAQSVDWQIFAEPFVTSAHAQELDWQKVDDELGRKPAVSGDVRVMAFRAAASR
jgi:hypothetical protein